MAKKKDKVNNPSLSRPLLGHSSSTTAASDQQPASPMPQPYNPHAAPSPTDYSSSHASDVLSPSAPPPAYSHHDPAAPSHQQIQSYHQPSSAAAVAARSNPNNTHPAAVLVPMPANRSVNIPPDYQPCVDGFAHKIRTDLTLSGVLCGILLFPIGLACMLTWLERRCTKCGRKFR